MMVKISVILPIYNIEAEHLRECVFSLLNQTFTEEYELILVNDGSDDYIDQTCRELEKTDKRIIYIPIAHAGVSVARNTGMENANGEYIAFVDPDDWVESDYLEVLYKNIAETNADIAVTGCYVNYPSKAVVNDFLPESQILTGKGKDKLLYQLLGKKICEYYPPEISAGVPWCKLFKASFLKEKNLRYVPGMIRMQDNIFCLYSIEEAGKISYVKANPYHYRMNYASASHGYNTGIISSFEKYYSETHKFLDRYKKEHLLFAALQMKELTSFNSYFSYYFFHEKSTLSYSQAKVEIKSLLDKEPYSSALKSVDYQLLNKQESLFVFLLKHKQIALLRMLVMARNKLK